MSLRRNLRIFIDYGRDQRVNQSLYRCLFFFNVERVSAIMCSRQQGIKDSDTCRLPIAQLQEQENYARIFLIYEISPSGISQCRFAAFCLDRYLKIRGTFLFAFYWSRSMSIMILIDSCDPSIKRLFDSTINIHPICSGAMNRSITRVL